MKGHWLYVLIVEIPIPINTLFSNFGHLYELLNN
jgi:hypothetical protein